jgi:hypothetical protein
MSRWKTVIWPRVRRGLSGLGESMAALAWLGYAFVPAYSLWAEQRSEAEPPAGPGTPATPTARPEQQDRPRPGPPAAHPERLVPHVPPTPIERELWDTIERTDS